MYNPRDWNWIVGGDESQAWSSAQSKYIKDWDRDRTTRIASEDELGDILRPLGLALPKPTMSDYESAIEVHMDEVARSRGYKDADRLVSYSSSTNAEWAAVSSAFVSWRDSVWLAAYAELAKVEGGKPAPSVADLIALLPSIDWPK